MEGPTHRPTRSIYTAIHTPYSLHTANLALVFEWETASS